MGIFFFCFGRVGPQRSKFHFGADFYINGGQGAWGKIAVAQQCVRQGAGNFLFLFPRDTMTVCLYVCLFVLFCARGPL